MAKEIILMKKGQIISAGPGSTLLAGMNGKVWESRMSQADFRRAQKERPDILVANVALDGEECVVRILAEERPYDNAEPVPATYEDLSLYTFTEGFAPQAEPAEQA